MKETTIIEKMKIPKLRDAILITGLPGIGLIGQIVGRYLVEELKAKKITTVLSPHFPHQVFMTKKGKLRLIKNSMFLYRAKKRDVIILVGDVQAISSVGQYEVAGSILDFSEKFAIKEILTVGGYSTGKINQQRRIFAVSTSEELRAKFEKMGVIFGEAKGSIVGAAGLLPALGSLRGIPGICIMGETHGGYVDTFSAKIIVELLSRYLELSVNLKRLDARAKESKKIIQKVEEDIKKNMEAQLENANPTTVSYIR